MYSIEKGCPHLDISECRQKRKSMFIITSGMCHLMFEGSHGMQSRKILTSLQCQIPARSHQRYKCSSGNVFSSCEYNCSEFGMAFCGHCNQANVERTTAWVTYICLYIFLGCMFLPVSAIHFLMYCMHNSLSLP